MNKSYHKISRSFPNMVPSLPITKSTSYHADGSRTVIDYKADGSVKSVTVEIKYL